ncbi:Y4yA family PLP-dependent enzyme OS=Streptomyces alboniger OX=132473 GN=CP975_28160 PE=4 SV=1 [Streptomyces alboniger]
MEGFSFHLSGYALQPRADMAARLVELCLKARVMGLEAGRISIGGGLPISYTDADSWHAFLETQRPAHYHAGKTFNSGDFYPYHSPASGAHADRPAADPPRARSRHTRPGSRRCRSGAAAGAGPCPAGPGRRHRLPYSGGQGPRRLPAADGQRHQPEPVGAVVQQRVRPRPAADPAAAEYPNRRVPRQRRRGHLPGIGHAHLAQDRLPSPATRRGPPALPNTAGYQMDSNESPFHDLPLPPKVVIDRTDRPRPRWRLDRHFT